MELPAKSTEQIHIMTDYTSLQWVQDGQIAIINLTTDTRKAIDDWYHVIAAVAEDWDSDQTFLAVYDLTDVGLTPYFRKRSIDVAKAVSHLKGRYAVIIPPGNAVSSVMRLYFETSISQTSMRQGRIFEEQESAISWLQELL